MHTMQAGCVFVICLATLPSLSAPARSQDLKAGRALAERLCGSCHAIDATGSSTLPKAPPFRAIVSRYSVWNLQEALAEGIVTGHAAMPEFRLEPREIGDLLSYMDSLGAPRESDGGRREPRP